MELVAIAWRERLIYCNNHCENTEEKSSSVADEVILSRGTRYELALTQLNADSTASTSQSVTPRAPNQAPQFWGTCPLPLCRPS